MSDPKWEDTTEPTWDETEEAPKWEDTDEPSMLESGIRGAAQSGSLGFADELTGAVGAGIEKLKGSDLPIADLYAKERDDSRAAYAKAEQANPKSYMAGEFTGAIGTSLVPGLNVAKGASIANMAGKAALQSGLQSIGSSEESALPNMETAKDALIGGAFGAAGGVLTKPLDKISDMLKSRQLENKLKDFAEERAAISLGATKRDLKSQKGLKNAMNMGREALDKGIVTPSAKTEDMLAKVAGIKSEAGSSLDDIISQIDNAGLSDIDAQNLKDQVLSKVDETYGQDALGNLSKKIQGLGESTLDPITGQQIQSKIPLKDIQDIKAKVGEVGYPKGQLPLAPSEKQLAAQKAKGLLDEQIQSSAEKASNVLGEDVLNKYLQAKKDYGFGKEAEKLLRAQNASEKVGDLGKSLSKAFDYGAVAAAPFTGGATIAPLISKKVGEALYDQRNQLAATASDFASKQFAAKGDQLARYADLLSQAAKSGIRASGAVSTLNVPTTVSNDDISDASVDSLLQKAQTEGLDGMLLQNIEKIKSMKPDERKRAMIALKDQPAFRSLMNRK